MKYKIELYQDNIYAVYDNNSSSFDYVFKGSLEEVNAWISLKEKGYQVLCYNCNMAKAHYEKCPHKN